MATFTTSVQFAAKPEQVFDVITDIPRWSEQVEAIKKIEMVTKGPVRVGTRFRETRIVFKKEATEEMEVTEFQRPDRFTVAAESCGAAFQTVHRFAPEGKGTRLMVDFTAQPQTFLARLMAPLTRWMLSSCIKAWHKDLEDARPLIEQNDAPVRSPS